MSLATLAQKRNCPYLDTYSIMLGSNGKPFRFFYQPDGEHLAAPGYRRWADSLLVPYITATSRKCAAMVGDSITRRVNVVPMSDGSEGTWDDLLGIKAYNLGVDGETTQDVINRLDSVIQPDADCYFVMIGNNDLHAGIPIQEITANVDFIIQTLAHTGKPVIVQAVMPLFP
jgi:lysophospholipase L1-like esterase